MREVVDACRAADVAAAVLSAVVRVDEFERSRHRSHLARPTVVVRSRVASPGPEAQEGDDVVEELRAPRRRPVVRRAPAAAATDNSGVSKGRLVAVCRPKQVDRGTGDVGRRGSRQLDAAIEDQLSLLNSS